MVSPHRIPVVVALALVACGESDRAAAPPSSDASIDAAPAPPTKAALPPLGGVWIEPIDDVGLVAVPLGATAPRPIVLSFHGAGSLAEYACGEWMYPTKAYPFIVCPRTSAERAGRLASWSSLDDLVKRGRATLEKVRAKYGAYVADADPIVVGFSQGAELAVLAAQRKLLPWSALFVHEGGYRQSKDALAALLRGDAPVYATCCTWGCGQALPSRVGERGYRADYGPHGHAMAPVADRLRADFGAMVRGRAEWEGYFSR